MTNNYFKIVSAAITACIVCTFVAFLQSCNNEEAGMETNSIQKENVKFDVQSSFKTDLRQLLKEYNYLMLEYKRIDQQQTSKRLHKIEGLILNDSLPLINYHLDSLQLSAHRDSLLFHLSNLFQTFINNHNMTEDLTPHEIEGLNINEERIEILVNDTDSFMVYASEYKTQTFCSYINNHYSNYETLSIPEIVNNTNLKMNEKLILSIIAITSSYEEMTDLEIGSDLQISIQECYNTYRADRRWCRFQYDACVCTAFIFGVASGGTLGVASTITSTALSTWFLDDCLDKARNDYIRCKNDAQGNN